MSGIKISKKRWIAIIVILLLLLAGGYIWYKYYHLKPESTKIVNTNYSNTNNPTNKDVVGATGQSSPTNASSQNSTSNQKVGNTTTSTTPPQPPSGSFVSDHNPNSVGENELSVCDVAPGVSCSITFTMNGNTIAIKPPQTAGASGVVSWTWSPQGLGLTAGDWTISATASLDGNSSTTKDTKVLEIQ